MTREKRGPQIPQDDVEEQMMAGGGGGGGGRGGGLAQATQSCMMTTPGLVRAEVSMNCKAMAA